MFRMRRAFLAITVLTLVSMPSGQEQASTKKEGSHVGGTSPTEFSQRSFESLLRERDSLTVEIDGLTADISWINDAISKWAEMKRLSALHKSTDEIESGINQSLGYAHISGTAFDDIDKQLGLKNGALTDKQQRKAAIDAELVRRADIVGPQQRFKLEMSLIFAVLVGLVILGFFVVAFRDERVRQEIFSGQAGIQFVTLFSLVIAIILFGIIDILEGKELAALLGGLSGYILGRSTPTTKERSNSAV
jgi:hypothetical protein